MLPIQKVLIEKGYRIFKRPFELNIAGVRSTEKVANRFDDCIHVFFCDENYKWICYSFLATTDPGRYWLKNPLQARGTAILKAGQYCNCYTIGLHRGKYPALVQQMPVTVIRDANRDNVLDFSFCKTATGLFGINIHHAAANGVSKTVDKYSAGCQVIASAADFALLMRLAERHRKLYGNVFSYTLVEGFAR